MISLRSFCKLVAESFNMSLAENCERKASQINTNYLLVLATHLAVMTIFSNACSMGTFRDFN